MVHRSWDQSLTEVSILVTSTIAVRARAWFREFREIGVKCVVHNIERAVTQ